MGEISKGEPYQTVTYSSTIIIRNIFHFVKSDFLFLVGLNKKDWGRKEGSFFGGLAGGCYIQKFQEMDFIRNNTMFKRFLRGYILYKK